ncbi:MAG: 5-(carboxyamino)imidazole ribonucleotide synthase [Synechococcaceae cyanobacterium]|nr:5-(carboxyamino)imidazole ribonucleotide synthase [Synechococcaceae cyanobacterium]
MVEDYPCGQRLVESNAASVGITSADAPEDQAGKDADSITIGIVGAGQLAGMLAEAAETLGVRLYVQAASTDDPAVSRAHGVVIGAVDDVAATRVLAGRASVISFENEWVPLDALAALRAEGVTFLPDLDVLRPLVCKRRQRELLDRLHLPAPRWCPLEAVLIPPPTQPTELNASSLAAPEPPDPLPPPPPVPRLPEGFRFPVMAKATTGGYDGRGIRPLADQAELEAHLDAVPAEEWILEELVAFEMELALVACRDRDGSVVCYPLVQTHQHHQVCDWVLMPAPVDHAVAAFARNVAASLLTALDYVGVLTLEFFFGPAGLQVNELAPRTHNSGHLTIEACRCSQFAQQVRIVAGLPMGLADPLVAGALMINLLGFEHSRSDYAERRQALRALPHAHLHWYSKPEASPGRKLGHLTVLLEGTTAEQRAGERDRILEAVRRIWPLPADGNESA